MAFLWRREEASKSADPGTLVLPETEAAARPAYVTLLYFVILLAILVFGAAGNWPVVAVAIAALVIVLLRWFEGAELKDWMLQTWSLFKKIFPILLAGVFVAGILRVLLPQEVVQHWLGGNGIRATALASIFGALMYFSTLTEVPIVRVLLDLGMGRGPALTLLLAGPALSLPNMIVIARVMGVRKTAAYVCLVAVMATVTGIIFGNLAR
jgi:uncharacterized membrane protein YraQ (UPF0718 family)